MRQKVGGKMERRSPNPRRQLLRHDSSATPKNTDEEILPTIVGGPDTARMSEEECPPLVALLDPAEEGGHTAPSDRNHQATGRDVTSLPVAC